MPTLAFLGATGNCAGHCLASSLLSTSPIYTCRALARNPSSLLSSLRKKGVSEDLLRTRLTIITGDAKDISSVTSLLFPTDAEAEDVETVVFGIGAQPTLQASIFRPVGLTDAEICKVAMATLLRALDQGTKDGKKKQPKVVVFSTTGISRGPRDVPLLYVPLYHWLLIVPHEDKRAMEDLLRERKGFVIVRSTLLTDGVGVGWKNVRAGTEDEPTVGWTIARKDVGEWVFEMVVKGGSETDGRKGVGRDVVVTLTN